MCVFTAEVEHVTNTNIYARARGDLQTLVYSMAYAASSPLAMVLPIPVKPGSGEDAVRFIDLSQCAMFFEELRAGFPRIMEGDVGTLSAGSLDEVDAPPKLEVRHVGAYEASFVPTPADFGRLDERFRLPAELWLELSNYRDWGFAVFQLRETQLAEVHPMAFDFPRRHRDRLFFPTLHIHHGRLEKRAQFDHTLYCQPEPALNWHLKQWEDSTQPVAGYVHCAEALKLFDADYPAWRAVVHGTFENRDTWIGRGETLPA
jgi:hypothetical protein